MTTRYDVLAVDGLDVLGEGPWWDVASGRLLWVDIKGHRVRSAHLDGSDATAFATSSEPGFVVPDEDGQLVVGLRDGLWLLDGSGAALRRLMAPDYDMTTNRINDGKTDRAGRVWFGTMEDLEKTPSSAVYRMDHGVTDRQFGGVITSNGLGWSPDDTVMYHTDSLTRSIYAYDFDLATGSTSNRRVFAQDPPDCVPDGLTIDAEGCVWAAKWDGGRLLRYAPNGSVVARVDLPVVRPTSCAFVGDRLDVLAVTTAQAPGTEEPLAGRVLLLDVGVTGIPERRALPANGGHDAWTPEVRNQ
jgi:L-arabinonolactonase